MKWNLSLTFTFNESECGWWWIGHPFYFYFLKWIEVKWKWNRKGIWKAICSNESERGWPAPTHPPFKATWTGARRTRLGNYDFCPTLAETKRKNIILDHMNSRICLGSSQFWLHKFGQITIKFSGSPCGQERLNSNSRVAFDHQIVIIIIKLILMEKRAIFNSNLKSQFWFFFNFFAW